MGHLSIVSRETIEHITDEHPYIEIGATLGRLAYKTISDLFSDVMIVRRGDMIFTWMINSSQSPGVGFDRYYIATGNVYFAPEDEFPIKIEIERGVKYINPISEQEALDLFRDKLLWNAIGKKSLGRGRGFTHQSLDEDNLLIDLLGNENETPPNNIITTPIFNTIWNHISISNFADTNTNPPIDAGTPLSNVNVSDIIWNNNHLFIYEKALEAYICKNVDNPNCNILSLLGYADYNVKWHANYLPYGVAGSNIDFVVEIENPEGDKKVLVFELKLQRLPYDDYKYFSDYQVIPYSVFIKKAYSSFGHNNIDIVPIILTANTTRPITQAVIHNNVKWIGYTITSNGVQFNLII